MQKQACEWFDLVEYYKKISDIHKANPSAAYILKKAAIIERGGMTMAAGK
jgi:hypothetical protein